MHTNLLGRRAAVVGTSHVGEVVGIAPCGDYGAIYVVLLFDNGSLGQYTLGSVRVEALQQEHPFR